MSAAETTIRVWLEWKPQDLWVGAFWKWTDYVVFPRRRLDVWVCLVPMVPIHFVWIQHQEPEPGADPARCPKCGWPLAASRAGGCVAGDCSYRGRGKG